MFIVHYAELGIKGRNRDFFEEKLVSNIRTQLKGLPVGSVLRRTGFIRIETGNADPARVLERLKMVAGVATVLAASEVEKDPERISKEAVAQFLGKQGTFRVTVRRADKRFALTSQALSALVGEAILRSNPKMNVDLHAPHHVCWIEVAEDGAFVADQKVKAAGGLPLGTGGKLVSLLSGGIDSPVASWMMARRGSPLHLLHFHNFPYTDRTSIDIVKTLAKILNRTAIATSLSLINLTPIQEGISAACHPSYRVLLYRRMMFRLAERIARREGAHGLVTGESLGQVASQTVENLRVIEAVTTLPVLRPLVGMDKEEIVDRARAIGTYEVSILPHADCCSLFLPPKPATKAQETLIVEEEEHLEIEPLLAAALHEEERLDVKEVSW